jgi:hypothetical protein
MRTQHVPVASVAGLAVLVAGLVAGCGPSTTKASGSKSTPSTSASVSSSANPTPKATGTPKVPSTPSRTPETSPTSPSLSNPPMVGTGHETISYYNDNNRSISIAVGTTLTLSQSREFWGATTSSNPKVLQPQRPRGVMPMYCVNSPVVGPVCPSNLTTTYLAVAPGVATISGRVALCPAGQNVCGPSTETEGGRFELTVNVVALGQ